jgi:hypothetical protein
MNFAKIDGLDVYRLVAYKADNTYSVQDGSKTPLTLVPLETIDEAIDFIYKHNLSRGNADCRYVLVEN